MAWDHDDTDLLPLVAVGAALVATATALSSILPVIGFLIILGGVTLLVFTVVRMVRRQQGRKLQESMPRRPDAWLLAVVFGMMLAGGGAALSGVHAPLVGLGVALGGGVLCGVGGWRMIVGANGRD